MSTYHPDYLLVELGFNDLGWGVSDPNGLINSVDAIIANARSAEPSIRILMANVVHRTYIPALPNLGRTITQYDNQLAAHLPQVNTAQSPVRLVDIDAAYKADVDTYDGLHPNSIGEFKIARSFANVLYFQFSLGGSFGDIPTTAEDRTPGVPTLSIQSTPAGMSLSWTHVFGVSGYRFYGRDVTVGQPFQLLPLPIPADSWKDSWIQNGHEYQYKVVALHGDQAGGDSNIVDAVGNVTTTTPGAVTVIGGPTYVDLIWGPAPEVTGGGPVNHYVVYYLDQTKDPGE